MRQKEYKSKGKITKVEVTTDTGKEIFQGIFMDNRRGVQEDIEAIVYMAIKNTEA